MIEDPTGTPYYKQYVENGIRGGALAGTFASVMFLICLVQRFRWKETDRDSLCEYDLQRPTMSLKLNGLLVESDEQLTSSSIQLITKYTENSMETLLEDDLSDKDGNGLTEKKEEESCCCEANETIKKEVIVNPDRANEAITEKVTVNTNRVNEAFNTADRVNEAITEEDTSDEESAKVVITAQITDVDEVAKVLNTASGKVPENIDVDEVAEVLIAPGAKIPENIDVDEVAKVLITASTKVPEQKKNSRKPEAESCEAIEANVTKNGSTVTETTGDQVTRDEGTEVETTEGKVDTTDLVEEDSVTVKSKKNAADNPEPKKVGGCCCSSNPTESAKENAAFEE